MPNKGRTEKAVTNIAFNLTNQIVSLVLSFVSRWAFIQGLGIGYLGINGLFTDILSLLSMADLGFNTAMVFSFYKPLAENDREKTAALICFYRRIYICIACAISVIGVALIPFLPKLVKLDHEVEYLWLYYLISLSGVVSSYLFIYKTCILEADQKGYRITRIHMATNIVKTILQIIVIFVFKNYIIYLVLGTLHTVANNLIASHAAQKEYPYIKDKRTLEDTEKRDIFQNIGSVFLYKVSSVLLNATDNIIISVIIGTVYVGLYSNYLSLQIKITTIFSLFFTSMIASIGNLIVTESKERRYEIFQCQQSMSFIISGIACTCYVVLVDDLISVWLGSEYKLQLATTCAIGLNLYLSCVLQPLWSYREATGLYRKTKWIMLICAAENIILSIILGKTIGITGVILASAISRITTYVWFEPRILFREYFGIKPGKYFVSLMINLVLIVLLVAAMRFCSARFVIENWFQLALKAVPVGLISSAVMLLTYSKTEGFAVFKEKAISLMKRFKPAAKTV